MPESRLRNRADRVRRRSPLKELLPLKACLHYRGLLRLKATSTEGGGGGIRTRESFSGRRLSRSVE